MMSATQPSLAVEALIRWKAHPARFVRDVFGVIPDAWQDDVLEAFPHHQRIAMKASKGPGKTCVLAWLAWNFLLTRPHPKVAATSISADNLSDNLWTEMAFWRNKSPLLQATFDWTKTRIEAKESPETWWMAARSWPKTADRNQQSLTLAGLHADYILFLLDESGGIPEAVMAAAEAALASCKEGHIVQAGNPTHLEGPLYRACTVERRLWHVIEISGDPDDPKRSPRVSIQWAREQIEKYGRDNPYVLINVFGRFPPSSLNTLIGPDEVEEATRRQYRETDYAHAARILGVDVARFGDDSSIIFPRQGLVAFPPSQQRNIDGTQGAGLVARKWIDWDVDAVFCDDTGGYGASWIDNLIRLGHAPIGVGFASKPNDARFLNKRAEMAFDCVEWIKRGGHVPHIPELTAALTQTTYTYNGDRLMIEPKDDIKQRICYSPDFMDALMLTFAAPVMRKSRQPGGRRTPSLVESEYQPFADAYAVGQERRQPTRSTWPGIGGWSDR
jgi:phage terminase large subunit